MDFNKRDKRDSKFNNYNESLWNNWKQEIQGKNIKGITKINSDLIKQFLNDMSLGLNISKSSKKGRRGYGRLNVVRIKLIQTIKFLEKRGVNDIREVKREHLHTLINDIQDGVIKRLDGKEYTCPSDFVRNFKTFWHWYMKINRIEGKPIMDVCEDLDCSNRENKFCYLTKEQIDELIDTTISVIVTEKARNGLFKNITYQWIYSEQVFMKFLFDSILRCPSEVANVRIRNIYLDEKGNVIVDITPDIGTKTKTSIRKFNLLFCGEEILKYIESKKLKPDDYLFGWMRNSNNAMAFNKKLKIIAEKLFGDGKTIGGEHYSNMTAYDFRHNGACYLRWLASQNGHISLDKIRQRGGWKDFEMLSYYTKLLGLDGVIDKELTLSEDDRTQLQVEVENVKKDKNKLQKDLKKERLAREQLGIKVKKMESERETMVQEVMQKVMEELAENETYNVNREFMMSLYKPKSKEKKNFGEIDI